MPKDIGRVVWLTQLLPRRLREGLGRAMKADRVLAGADLGARQGYELRAAKSDPQLPPAS